jgi:hypothetical protein
MGAQENDIILCDGDCRRAYHERCLDPPIDASALPEDEGWLCPACDAKVGHHTSCVLPARGLELHSGSAERDGSAIFTSCPALRHVPLVFLRFCCCWG